MPSNTVPAHADTFQHITPCPAIQYLHTRTHFNTFRLAQQYSICTIERILRSMICTRRLISRHFAMPSNTVSAHAHISTHFAMPSNTVSAHANSWRLATPADLLVSIYERSVESLQSNLSSPVMPFPFHGQRRCSSRELCSCCGSPLQRSPKCVAFRGRQIGLRLIRTAPVWKCQLTSDWLIPAIMLAPKNKQTKREYPR